MIVVFNGMIFCCKIIYALLLSNFNYISNNTDIIISCLHCSLVNIEIYTIKIDKIASEI